MGGIRWVIAALILWVIGYVVGVGPIPWVYTPEVFDSRFRSKGCSLGLSGSRTCSTVQGFFFPILYPIFGLSGLFAFLAITSVVAAMFVFLCCPETSGVPLEDVPRLFDVKFDTNKA